jgi:REP element-mobilizing transposase RayT
MNRGRRGEQVFEVNDDYELFIEILQEAIELFALRVSAFCLMPNHYHVLVQTPDANLSRCMRHINGVYTQRYNRKHSLDGQLFRGRYKAIVVAEDNYLLQLVRYIHRNPIRAGMVDNAEHYDWSSHKGYLSYAKKWDWLHKQFILSMLTKNRQERVKRYRAFMGEADDATLLRILSLKKLPSILGDNQFVDRLKRRFFEQKRHIEVPESKCLAPDMALIKGVICKYYGIEETQLSHTKRAVFNEPRAMGLYLSRHLRGESLKAIGRQFKIGNYSTVSTVIERFKARIRSDRALAQRVDQVRQAIMSQEQT